MANIEFCPFCGKEHEICRSTNELLEISCSDEIPTFFINAFVLDNIDDKEKAIRMNSIVNFVVNKPYANFRKEHWHFYWNKDDDLIQHEWVNVYYLERSYPKTFIEKMNKILFNLSYIYQDLSKFFCLNDLIPYARFIYCETNDFINEIRGMISMLVNLKYLEEMEDNKYRISADGWKKIEDLTHDVRMLKNAFIAMSFDKDCDDIYDAFKIAISNSGYNPVSMKELQHNNYIMPEMFHEIEQSRFLVVDITRQNYGAYYEAGYGLGIGREVIICCRTQEFNDKETRPHFDIAQKNIVLWDTKEGLIINLQRRIEATIK